METQLKLIVLVLLIFWMDCALLRLLEVIKRVDVITVNDEEARQLSPNIILLLRQQLKSRNGSLNYVVVKKRENIVACVSHGQQSIFLLQLYTT
jgi:sugar/nucleoside kinase (ribokinase family)